MMHTGSAAFVMQIQDGEHIDLLMEKLINIYRDILGGFLFFSSTLFSAALKN